MIDDITIDIWHFQNFASNVIEKKCKSIVNLSKFISNKKILSGVVDINCDQLLVAKLCVKCNTF